MPELKYAIVDIETTGGFASGNHIIEICIIVTDGENELDRFDSLIFPGVYVPRFITGFTGITQDMVDQAPPFKSVAKRIYEILHDCVFVAHSVNFDYSFVKKELEKEGYEIPTKKLCTVRLSRKIVPGYKSYSLGNICAALNIPLLNRHRAFGDAEATYLLFKELLKRDSENCTKDFLKRNSKEHYLPPHIPKENISNLPPSPGVYYFHDARGKYIYIGKAKNLKQRVSSHFSNNKTNKQKQDFIREIHAISFVECATETMALLLESVEIKQHWAKFNRSQKRYEAKYGIYSYYDQKGFLRLGIEKKRKVQKAIVEATSLFELKRQLEEAVIEFKLCRKLLGLQLGACAVESNCAVCEAKTTALKHNNRLNKSIKKLSQTEALVYKEAIPLSDKYFVAIAKDGLLCMGVTDNSKTPKNIKLPIEDSAFKTYSLNSFVSHNLRKLTDETWA